MNALYELSNWMVEMQKREKIWVITVVLNLAVRQISKLETNIVSVERVKEYSNTASEAEWESPDGKPPKSWPSGGRISIENYST
ncbi:hypothetical protein GCK32_019377, partial [Trichostrongylus colubriformis]